jgi:Uma2 family endonuclease
VTSHAKHPAGPADLQDLPEHVVGEILAGELHVSPRPAARHAHAATALAARLYPLRPGRGDGDPPGGWWILFEPELHLGADILVPDLAGWRTTRLPTIPDAAFFTLAPDWVCEVLSPSTQRLDRMKKMPRYASAGVGHLWLLDPGRKTLDVFVLKGGEWVLALAAGDDDTVPAPPFVEHPLDLGALW